MSGQLDYSRLEQLKQSEPALKLLNRDSLAMILSFLYQEFILPNRHSIPQSELIGSLGNYLYDLKEQNQLKQYNQSPKGYLEDWASTDSRILRKYYPTQTQEAVYDLTPSTVRVIQFLESLEVRQFVGTESRMKNLLQMLKTLMQESETDPKVLISEYERQIKELEAKIEALRIENDTEEPIDLLPVDESQIRGQYFEIQDMARSLLYDFRQVEENFRLLDQKIREHFATSDENKGDVLDKVFEEHDEIRWSDQGKSFWAFWEFLMSPQHQDELRELLEHISQLSEIKNLDKDSFLGNFAFYLLDAGEAVYKSYNLITEQLRKYLEGQIHIENRRIIELVKEIEKHAISLKDLPKPPKIGLIVPRPKPAIRFPMSRTLFTPPKRPEISQAPISQGEANLDLGALYPPGSVDEERLLGTLRQILEERDNVSLAQLTELAPIQEGLAEVLTYFRFATHSEVPAEIIRDEKEQIVWNGQDVEAYRIELPKVVFRRITIEET